MYYLNQIIKIEPSVLSIATALTLGGAIITLFKDYLNKKREDEKFEKELFIEFNERYDKLNDSLSLLSEIKFTEELDLVDFLQKTNSTIDNKTMYQVLIDYFNLCSEQYYWKKKKRIAKEIWDAWHAGMMYYYEKFPIVKKLWEIETKGNGAKSYYLKGNEDFFKLDCAL